MILMSAHSAAVLGNHQQNISSTCSYEYETMYNNRYYRSFHGTINSKSKEHSSACKTVSNFANNADAACKSKGLHSPATAGLLRDYQRSNSSPCLDEDGGSLSSNNSQACPYAVSRYRNTTKYIPSMYGTGTSVPNTNKSSPTCEKVLNGIKTSKGNKVANLKSKFDSMTEKAKNEEIKSTKSNALRKSSTEKITNEVNSNKSKVLKSSTSPDCRMKTNVKKDLNRKTADKVVSVKQAVRSFEKTTSSVESDRLETSKNDAPRNENVRKDTISSSKESKITNKLKTLPAHMPKTSQIDVKNIESAKSPQSNCDLRNKKSVPVKNVSSLHKNNVVNKKEIKIEAKIIPRKEISRAKLGKAPEPPKMACIARAPVPQPRKCWIEKAPVPVYLNKNDCDKVVASVEKKEKKAEKININDRVANAKSKSLPNSSFLWNYRESIASSCESLDRTETNESEYFEDPYVDNESLIAEYASTSLMDHDEPIYMEANFLDTKPKPSEISAKNSESKESGESDEGWVDVSENELDDLNLSKHENNLKLRKKNVGKNKAKRLSWSHSMQRLNKQTQNGGIDDSDNNDIESVSSCADSMDHQYEALYDIISQSSIVLDVDQGSIPQLPERDHSPMPRMKNKAISKDSGISDYKSLTMDPCLDDDGQGITKMAGEKIRKIKRNWSLTKSDIRIELSSRLNWLKPKKTSKSAADLGSSKEIFKSNVQLSTTSPNKETAQFYICDESESARLTRPYSESFDVESQTSGNSSKENRRVSITKITRPTVSPPLPPADRQSYEPCQSRTPSLVSSDGKSSTYDLIWYSSTHSSTTKEYGVRSSDDTSSNKSISSSKASTTSDSNSTNDILKNNGILKKKMLDLPLNTTDSLIAPEFQVQSKSPIDEEPLYQFYQENMRKRTSLWYNTSDGSGSDFGSNNYEDVEEVQKKTEEKTRRTSAIEIVRGEVKVQTLWSEIPEVQNSGILARLSSQEKKLQEAIFEVMTSEASYLKSLDILVNHFMNCSEFIDEFSTECVLGRHERHVLFSDVIPVYEVSKRLLSEFEHHWQENVMLPNITDILYEHATKYFSVYVKYCSNQIYQDRQYKELKESKPEFVEVLRKLESSPECQNLSLHSFLMLPMQRITRLPLLVDAIYHRLEAQTYHYESSKKTLACLNKIVAECNEGARKMERMEEMLRISQQINFKECKGIPLISSNRWLVKKGDLTKLSLSETSGKITFGKASKFSKVNVYLFLFTDYLLITKRKGDGTFTVLDYCPRNMVQVSAVEDENILKLPFRPPDGIRNLFHLTMLQNHEGKTVEILFCCNLESERTRWMEAVTPPTSENPDEKIYEEWDCPQVQVVHSYPAQQPDELTLEESDVVNVFRKMADGWYQGERMRDGVQGWFPANHTAEIVSSHVRARNLRQRYRLLALSHSYLLQAQKSRSK